LKLQILYAMNIGSNVESFLAMDFNRQLKAYCLI